MSQNRSIINKQSMPRSTNECKPAELGKKKFCSAMDRVFFSIIPSSKQFLRSQEQKQDAKKKHKNEAKANAKDELIVP